MHLSLWVWLIACQAPDAPEAGGSGARVGAPVAPAFVAPPAGVTAFGRSVAVGDFNGDGAPDVAIGALDARGRGQVTLWAAGGGGLVRTETYDASVGGHAAGDVVAWGDDGVSLAALDLDGDGYDDLVAGDPSFTVVSDAVAPYGARPRGRLVIRRGSPGGLVAPAWQEGDARGVRLGGNLRVYGDVDGDGRGDLLSVFAGDNWEGNADVVDLMVGLSNGTFARRSLVSGFLWPDVVGHTVAPVGDVDGDGRDDLAWTQEDRSPATLEALGEAVAFAPGGPSLSVTATPLWRVEAAGRGADLRESLADVGGPGDLNGDGIPDLLIGPDNVEGDLTWYAGGGGAFAATPSGALSMEPSDVPAGVAWDRGFIRAEAAGGRLVRAVGDTDGDGAPELWALALSSDEVLAYRWALGVGGPALVDVRGVDRSALGAPSDLVPAGDLDGDGLDDVIVTDGAGRLAVLWGAAPAGCVGGASASVWYLDVDGDGVASSHHARLACVAPAGASAGPGADCDDDDPRTHPGAADEPGVDRDCDGWVSCAMDADGDGYGTATWTSVEAPWCESRWRRVASVGGDCDDARVGTHPNVADGAAADLNCDGVVNCYADSDGDGFGAGAAIALTVTPGSLDACPAGYGPANNDCDDADPYAYATARTWYRDGDRDGYGSAITTRSCARPAGYAPVDGDCDDAASAVHPGAVETVGLRDEDCDGVELCYQDADLDGWGVDALVTVAGRCGATGAVAQRGDCDDLRAALHPGQAEDTSTAFDDNCNGYTAPTLVVSPVPAGLWVGVYDATPRRSIGVYATLAGRGAGPCPAFLNGACIGLRSPRVPLVGTTDASGDYGGGVPVTPALSGRTAWFQAGIAQTGGARGLVTPVASTVLP